MELYFDVGNHERHQVGVTFEPMVGRLNIGVDGILIMSKLLMVPSLRLTRTYRLVVGWQEQHEVTIVKTRKLVVSFLRPQIFRAYVDGELVAQGVA
jgi:hypothetical protein